MQYKVELNNLLYIRKMLDFQIKHSKLENAE